MALPPYHTYWCHLSRETIEPHTLAGSRFFCNSVNLDVIEREGGALASIRKRRWVTAAGEVQERWQADFVDQTGARRARQFKTRKAADAFMTTVRAQVQVGTYTPESASITVAEALELWLERSRAEGLEPGTVAMYRQHRAHILAAVDGKLKLSRLTAARVEQVRDALLAGHSRPMARKVLTTLKGVIKEAVRRGLVAQNAAAAARITGDGRHKRKLEVGTHIPTPIEVKALLEAADPKARALVALAALAGLRASEIRGLRWQDVELGPQPSVTIAQRADHAGKLGSPKSASSRRTIPLGETAVRALKEWRLAQPPGRSLVVGSRVDTPAKLDALLLLLRSIETQAGIRRYGWHSFRHYAISAWLASGIDPKTVQAWAGHGSLVVTLDTYGHLIPRQDDHARIAKAEVLLR